MKLVVAVSGGVDSVVLLDMLVKEGRHELLVAHFDHGIRPDSAMDAVFVAQLAQGYAVPFETRREELGSDASEELARNRRYAFLKEVAEKHQAVIATAHHMNDIAETIAINLTRGTGWRGIACLSSGIYRPFLTMKKSEIIQYATEHELKWREDSTNSSDAYLRNRLRPQLTDDDVVRQFTALRARQIELRDEIDAKISELSLQSPYSRHFFTMIDQSVAMECLRRVLDARATRPQLSRALVAIATMRPGSQYDVGSGVLLRFTARHFTIHTA